MVDLGNVAHGKEEGIEMLAVQILILVGVLLVIPYFAGAVFAGVENGSSKRLFQWISGQFLIWVGIEAIAALLILRQATFNKAVILFWFYIGAVLCYALGVFIRRKIRTGKSVMPAPAKRKRSVFNVVLWFLFGGLLIWQLVWVIWSFVTGDVSGGSDTFSLANPCSLWVVFLAEISGMSAVRVEQVVLPFLFLCMSYGIFYLLGAKLFVKKREHHALFLVVISLVAIGGGFLYRYFGSRARMSLETNLELVMLVMVVFPFLLLLAVMMVKTFGKKKKIR